MDTHRKRLVLLICTIVILILAAFTIPARGVVVNGTPGGYVRLPFGTMIDQATGNEYGLTLIAHEAVEMAEVGNVTLQVLGPSISVCSAHGGGVDIGTSENGWDFGGNFPLQEIQCGTAYGMAVSVEGCTLKAEMHGYSHSDYPLYTYMGSNTVEVTLRKSASGSQVNLKIYTPKGPIKLSGNVSDPVEMDTCP